MSSQRTSPLRLRAKKAAEEAALEEERARAAYEEALAALFDESARADRDGPERRLPALLMSRLAAALHAAVSRHAALKAEVTQIIAAHQLVNTSAASYAAGDGGGVSFSQGPRRGHSKGPPTRTYSNASSAAGMGIGASPPFASIAAQPSLSAVLPQRIGAGGGGSPKALSRSPSLQSLAPSAVGAASEHLLLLNTHTLSGPTALSLNPEAGGIGMGAGGIGRSASQASADAFRGLVMTAEAADSVANTSSAASDPPPPMLTTRRITNAFGHRRAAALPTARDEGAAGERLQIGCLSSASALVTAPAAASSPQSPPRRRGLAGGVGASPLRVGVAPSLAHGVGTVGSAPSADDNGSSVVDAGARLEALWSRIDPIAPVTECISAFGRMLHASGAALSPATNEMSDAVEGPIVTMNAVARLEADERSLLATSAGSASGGLLGQFSLYEGEGGADASPTGFSGAAAMAAYLQRQVHEKQCQIDFLAAKLNKRSEIMTHIRQTLLKELFILKARKIGAHEVPAFTFFNIIDIVENAQELEVATEALRSEFESASKAHHQFLEAVQGDFHARRLQLVREHDEAMEALREAHREALEGHALEMERAKGRHADAAALLRAERDAFAAQCEVLKASVKQLKAKASGKLTAGGMMLAGGNGFGPRSPRSASEGASPTTRSPTGSRRASMRRASAFLSPSASAAVSDAEGDGDPSFPGERTGKRGGKIGTSRRAASPTTTGGGSASRRVSTRALGTAEAKDVSSTHRGSFGASGRRGTVAPSQATSRRLTGVVGADAVVSRTTQTDGGESIGNAMPRIGDDISLPMPSTPNRSSPLPHAFGTPRGGASLSGVRPGSATVGPATRAPTRNGMEATVRGEADGNDAVETARALMPLAMALGASDRDPLLGSSADSASESEWDGGEGSFVGAGDLSRGVSGGVGPAKGSGKTAMEGTAATAVTRPFGAVLCLASDVDTIAVRLAAEGHRIVSAGPERDLLAPHPSEDEGDDTCADDPPALGVVTVLFPSSRRAVETAGRLIRSNKNDGGGEGAISGLVMGVALHAPCDFSLVLRGADSAKYTLPAAAASTPVTMASRHIDVGLRVALRSVVEGAVRCGAPMLAALGTLPTEAIATSLKAESLAASPACCRPISDGVTHDSDGASAHTLPLFVGFDPSRASSLSTPQMAALEAFAVDADRWVAFDDYSYAREGAVGDASLPVCTPARAERFAAVQAAASEGKSGHLFLFSISEMGALPATLSGPRGSSAAEDGQGLQFASSLRRASASPFASSVLQGSNAEEGPCQGSDVWLGVMEGLVAFAAPRSEIALLGSGGGRLLFLANSGAAVSAFVNEIAARAARGGASNLLTHEGRRCRVRIGVASGPTSSVLGALLFHAYGADVSPFSPFYGLLCTPYGAPREGEEGAAVLLCCHVGLGSSQGGVAAAADGSGLLPTPRDGALGGVGAGATASLFADQRVVANAMADAASDPSKCGYSLFRRNIAGEGIGGMGSGPIRAVAEITFRRLITASSTNSADGAPSHAAPAPALPLGPAPSFAQFAVDVPTSPTLLYLATVITSALGVGMGGDSNGKASLSRLFEQSLQRYVATNQQSPAFVWCGGGQRVLGEGNSEYAFVHVIASTDPAHLLKLCRGLASEVSAAALRIVIDVRQPHAMDGRSWAPVPHSASGWADSSGEVADAELRAALNTCGACARPLPPREEGGSADNVCDCATPYAAVPSLFPARLVDNPSLSAEVVEMLRSLPTARSSSNSNGAHTLVVRHAGERATAASPYASSADLRRRRSGASFVHLYTHGATFEEVQEIFLGLDAGEKGKNSKVSVAKGSGDMALVTVPYGLVMSASSALPLFHTSAQMFVPPAVVPQPVVVGGGAYFVGLATPLLARHGWLALHARLQQAGRDIFGSNAMKLCGPLDSSSTGNDAFPIGAPVLVSYAPLPVCDVPTRSGGGSVASSPPASFASLPPAAKARPGSFSSSVLSSSTPSASPQQPHHSVVLMLRFAAASSPLPESLTAALTALCSLLGAANGACAVEYAEHAVPYMESYLAEGGGAVGVEMGMARRVGYCADASALVAVLSARASTAGGPFRGAALLTGRAVTSLGASHEGSTSSFHPLAPVKGVKVFSRPSRLCAPVALFSTVPPSAKGPLSARYFSGCIGSAALVGGRFGGIAPPLCGHPLEAMGSAFVDVFTSGRKPKRPAVPSARPDDPARLARVHTVQLGGPQRSKGFVVPSSLLAEGQVCFLSSPFGADQQRLLFVSASQQKQGQLPVRSGPCSFLRIVEAGGGTVAPLLLSPRSVADARAASDAAADDSVVGAAHCAPLQWFIEGSPDAGYGLNAALRVATERETIAGGLASPAAHLYVPSGPSVLCVAITLCPPPSSAVGGGASKGIGLKRHSVVAAPSPSCDADEPDHHVAAAYAIVSGLAPRYRGVPVPTAASEEAEVLLAETRASYAQSDDATLQRHASGRTSLSPSSDSTSASRQLVYAFESAADACDFGRDALEALHAARASTTSPACPAAAFLLRGSVYCDYALGGRLAADPPTGAAFASVAVASPPLRGRLVATHDAIRDVERLLGRRYDVRQLTLSDSSPPSSSSSAHHPSPLPDRLSGCLFKLLCRKGAGARERERGAQQALPTTICFAPLAPISAKGKQPQKAGPSSVSQKAIPVAITPTTAAAVITPTTAAPTPFQQSFEHCALLTFLSAAPSFPAAARGAVLQALRDWSAGANKTACNAGTDASTSCCEWSLLECHDQNRSGAVAAAASLEDTFGGTLTVAARPFVLQALLVPSAGAAVCRPPRALIDAVASAVAACGAMLILVTPHVAIATVERTASPAAAEVIGGGPNAADGASEGSAPPRRYVTPHAKVLCAEAAAHGAVVEHFADALLPLLPPLPVVAEIATGRGAGTALAFGAVATSLQFPPGSVLGLSLASAALADAISRVVSRADSWGRAACERLRPFPSALLPLVRAPATAPIVGSASSFPFGSCLLFIPGGMFAYAALRGLLDACAVSPVVPAASHSRPTALNNDANAHCASFAARDVSGYGTDAPIDAVWLAPFDGGNSAGGNSSDEAPFWARSVAALLDTARTRRSSVCTPSWLVVCPLGVHDSSSSLIVTASAGGLPCVGMSHKTLATVGAVAAAHASRPTTEAANGDSSTVLYAIAGAGTGNAERILDGLTAAGPSLAGSLVADGAPSPPSSSSPSRPSNSLAIAEVPIVDARPLPHRDLQTPHASRHTKARSESGTFSALFRITHAGSRDPAPAKTITLRARGPPPPLSPLAAGGHISVVASCSAVARQAAAWTSCLTVLSSVAGGTVVSAERPGPFAARWVMALAAPLDPSGLRGLARGLSDAAAAAHCSATATVTAVPSHYWLLYGAAEGLCAPDTAQLDLGEGAVGRPLPAFSDAGGDGVSPIPRLDVGLLSSGGAEGSAPPQNGHAHRAANGHGNDLAVGLRAGAADEGGDAIVASVLGRTADCEALWATLRDNSEAAEFIRVRPTDTFVDAEVSEAADAHAEGKAVSAPSAAQTSEKGADMPFGATQNTTPRRLLEVGLIHGDTEGGDDDDASRSRRAAALREAHAIASRFVAAYSGGGGEEGPYGAPFAPRLARSSCGSALDNADVPEGARRDGSIDGSVRGRLPPSAFAYSASRRRASLTMGMEGSTIFGDSPRRRATGGSDASDDAATPHHAHHAVTSRLGGSMATEGFAAFGRSSDASTQTAPEGRKGRTANSWVQCVLLPSSQHHAAESSALPSARSRDAGTQWEEGLSSPHHGYDGSTARSLVAVGPSNYGVAVGASHTYGAGPSGDQFSLIHDACLRGEAEDAARRPVTASRVTVHVVTRETHRRGSAGQPSAKPINGTWHMSPVAPRLPDHSYAKGYVRPAHGGGAGSGRPPVPRPPAQPASDPE